MKQIAVVFFLADVDKRLAMFFAMRVGKMLKREMTGLLFPTGHLNSYRAEGIWR